jgi:hypothetical protein
VEIVLLHLQAIDTILTHNLKDKTQCVHQESTGLLLRLLRVEKRMTGPDIHLHPGQTAEVMTNPVIHLRKEAMLKTGVMTTQVIPLPTKVKANGVIMHPGNIHLLPEETVLHPVEAADHLVEAVVVAQAIPLLLGVESKLQFYIQIQNHSVAGQDCTSLQHLKSSHHETHI